MKVLWICNLPFPEAAEQLHIEASNKEGWISGMMHALFAGGIGVACGLSLPCRMFG